MAWDAVSWNESQPYGNVSLYIARSVFCFHLNYYYSDQYGMKVALTVFEYKNCANLYLIKPPFYYLYVHVSKGLMWSSSHKDVSINHCRSVNAFDEWLVRNLPIEEFGLNFYFICRTKQYNNHEYKHYTNGIQKEVK